MSLGKKIQSLRETQGLTQKELASIIGVSTGNIAEWEADEAAPGLAAVAKLSKVFGVSSDVLLDEIAETTETKIVEPVNTTLSTNSVKKKPILVICIAAFLAVVLVGIGLFLYPQDDEKEDEEIVETLPFSQDTAAIEAADASVVKLYCYDYEGELAATGSGFVAFDGKTIVTNYHVMTSAYTCKISTNQDISYDVANILCYSKEQDIAILELVKDTGLQPLTLGDSSIIKKGETVVAIGSPLGIKNTVSSGILSGRLMEDNMDVLQFTAPISSGSSGGALFDSKGNVIGITYASYIDGQNLNLAIPAELANSLYNSKGAAMNVEEIYIGENPHIAYLGEYKEATFVTLADLKKNPEKYSNTIVHLITYISSSGENGTYWWDSFTWYLADKNDVSLNYEYDSSIANNLSFGETPMISCWLPADDAKYIDNTLVPGDKIEIIAKFVFHPKGEETSIGTYLRDTASLDAILIWKRGY